MVTLNGEWTYRSFCPRAGAEEHAPTIAAPWAPKGVLTVNTDTSGKASGTLQFAPKVQLVVAGNVTPPNNGTPAGIELRAEGLGAIYEVRGYFASDTVIVGCVLSIAGDLGKQPAGTLGAFVLLAD